MKVEEILVTCHRCGGFFHLPIPDREVYKEEFYTKEDILGLIRSFQCFKCSQTSDLTAFGLHP